MKTIGIIGGGQLGKMISLSASYMGYNTHIFSPDGDNPAFFVTNKVTKADYNNTEALEEFAKSVDVVTLEFENIPVESIEIIKQHTPVYPDTNILCVAQNRILEKTFLKENDIPTAGFFPMVDDTIFDIAIAEIGRPSVLKTATLGYDGKGQFKIDENTSLEEAWQATGDGEKILEKWLSFDCEISVIVARNMAGDISCFPPTENVHKNHILDTSTVPANISEEIANKAVLIAENIALKMNLVGLLAVEMFVVGDEVLVNEIAPRPHNSGHWTIEGCVTSQFEQLIRAVCNLPLGATDIIYKKVQMTNLIGDEINTVDNDIYSKKHNYGKKEIKSGRKMGHITRLYP